MKILVTPRSFARHDPAPLRLLEDHRLEIFTNEMGRILDESDLLELVPGCHGIILGSDPLTVRVLEQAPTLKAIARYGVGMDNIDLEYCKKRGIIVSKTLGANSHAVADYAFALILALARRLVDINQSCKKGDWSKIMASDVSGKTLGLLGLGAIGREMVKRAQGFGMRILAHDVIWNQDYALAQGIEKATIDEICSAADFITLHLPLTPDTHDIIGAHEISLMKTTAYIINTARGGLIDEVALLEALKEKRIGGAGIDTFSVEPPDNPAWFQLDNVVLGSHCASSTFGSSHNMGMMAAENLLRDLGLLPS